MGSTNTAKFTKCNSFKQLGMKPKLSRLSLNRSFEGFFFPSLSYVKKLCLCNFVHRDNSLMVLHRDFIHQSGLKNTSGSDLLGNFAWHLLFIGSFELHSSLVIFNLCLNGRRLLLHHSYQNENGKLLRTLPENDIWRKYS